MPHISEQSHYVFNSAGECMVDFIGRTEHFKEDFAAFVEELGRRNGRTYTYSQPETQQNHHVYDNGATQQIEPSPSTCDLAYFKSMYDESIMRSMALQYSADLRNFGFMRRDLL